MMDIASIIGASTLGERATTTPHADSNSLTSRAQAGDEQAIIQLEALLTALQSTAKSFSTGAGSSPGQSPSEQST